MSTNVLPPVASTEVAIDTIRPSPENDTLYKPADPTDPAMIALAESIGTNGVVEPIGISLDRYVISGHRRLAAAKMAGLHTVPVRVIPVNRIGSTRDQWVAILREHNRQREKTLAERIREEVVDADPEISYRALLAKREALSDLSGNALHRIDTTVRKERSSITRAKLPMVNAIIDVLNERIDFWPLSDRQIHYGLLNTRPLKHRGKPDSIYANDRKSYGDLCDLLTRLRIDGTIPWEAIADETRPVSNWNIWPGASAFIRRQMTDFLEGYRRDLLQSQPNHVEIVGEKLTIKTPVDRVAGRFGVPTTIGRGYSSITPRRDIAERFKASGKSKLILLMLSDHDPEGYDIAKSFGASLIRDFGIPARSLEAFKVAIAPKHVAEFKLPPTLDAKASSSRYKAFAKEFGPKAYELEALTPDTIMRLLTEALDSVLDLDALGHEQDEEKNDTRALTAIKTNVVAAVADVVEGEE